MTLDQSEAAVTALGGRGAGTDHAVRDHNWAPGATRYPSAVIFSAIVPGVT